MTYKDYFEKSFMFNEFIKPLLNKSEEELEGMPESIIEMLNYYKSI
tara:strand:+ start:3338 stop:3475 length:138 start_codon:yes stop_codon:yes gene_type:complete